MQAEMIFMLLFAIVFIPRMATRLSYQPPVFTAGGGFDPLHPSSLDCDNKSDRGQEGGEE